MENLLNLHEAAKFLGYAEITVRQFVRRRQIPFIKIRGKLLFSPERLKRFLEAHTVEPVSDERQERNLQKDDRSRTRTR